MGEPDRAGASENASAGFSVLLRAGPPPYYRVEDNQILPVVAMDGADRGELTAGELYRVASYNIGASENASAGFSVLLRAGPPHRP